MTVPLKKEGVRMSSRREADPYDSEEEGYSTAEDEGNLEYYRPKMKVRPAEDPNKPKDGARKRPAPIPQPKRKPTPQAAKAGEVIMKEKTVQDLMNIASQSASLATRVETETGMKAPRTSISGRLVLNAIVPGDKVSRYCCFCIGID